MHWPWRTSLHVFPSPYTALLEWNSDETTSSAANNGAGKAQSVYQPGYRLNNSNLTLCICLEGQVCTFSLLPTLRCWNETVMKQLHVLLIMESEKSVYQPGYRLNNSNLTLCICFEGQVCTFSLLPALRCWNETVMKQLHLLLIMEPEKLSRYTNQATGWTTGELGLGFWQRQEIFSSQHRDRL
jgi:hypothetical protein